MKIDNDLLERLQTLSRLKLSEGEKAGVAKDLNNILTMVDTLEDLNTDNVEPLVYLSDDVLPLRKDVVKNQVDKEAALRNAPNADSDYFKTPTVIKQS